MQTSGARATLTTLMRLGILAALASFFFLGCVSHVYNPGKADCPLNGLQLGQTYGDMVKVLGKPDYGRTEDRMTQETILLFIPVWDIIESIGDFNPSMLQIYTYDRWGSITIDNNNHIIKIEAKESLEAVKH